jgi:hypothetical protein
MTGIVCLYGILWPILDATRDAAMCLLMNMHVVVLMVCLHHVYQRCAPVTHNLKGVHADSSVLL